MARFNELLRQATAAPERNSMVVKIADQDVELFAAPLTGSDLDRIMARHKNFATAPTVAAVIDLLIMKCETIDGDKAFDALDKPFLIKMPTAWINSLRAGLFPDQDADLSDEAIDRELGN